jgi:hypothetical protein
MTPDQVLDRLSMDRRWQATLWTLLALVVVAWGWLRLGSAGAEADRALARHQNVARDVQRITDLRQRTVAGSGAARPDADLVGRVQRALTSVGLPAGACQGVQPRTEQGGTRGSGPRMQTVELQLHGLTPGEFGSWLAAWNTPEQAWRISEILLNHQAGLTGQEGATVDSNRFQISVLLSAPAVEDSP